MTAARRANKRRPRPQPQTSTRPAPEVAAPTGPHLDEEPREALTNQGVRDFDNADEAVRWPQQNETQEEDDMAQLVEFTNRDKSQGPILVNATQILTVDAVNVNDEKQGTEIRLPDNVRAYVQESVEEVQARVNGTKAKE